MLRLTSGILSQLKINQKRSDLMLPRLNFNSDFQVPGECPAEMNGAEV